MIFEFENTKVFIIENSDLYKQFDDGTKTVECIVQLDNNILGFIEAKSSSPNPNNKEDYETFLNDITDKFLHSFNMYLVKLQKRKYIKILMILFID